MTETASDSRRISATTAVPRNALGPALAMEWVRARSILSTWVILGCCVASALLAYLVGRGQADLREATNGSLGSASLDTWISVVTAPVSTTAILVGIFAAMAIGHEFRYGTIDVVLTHLPRRRVLFAAKTIAVCGYGVVAGVVALVLGAAVLAGAGLWNRVGGDAVTPGLFAGLMCRSALVVCGFGLVFLAVTALTRSMRWGIILPIIWLNFVEVAIGAVPAMNKGVWRYVLPFRDAQNALDTSRHVFDTAGGTNPWLSLGVFLAAAVIVVWVSAVRFSRMDV